MIYCSPDESCAAVCSGKTEIDRRLAKLVSAHVIKVEHTKYTELGYVGREVEDIVKDLVEASVRLVRQGRESEALEHYPCTIER